jgi:hypothetical protein
MRQTITAILAECRKSGLSSVLWTTRGSRPLFKVQEFGLSAFLQEMSPACKVALVSENPELRAADEYIATMAQQSHANVRAFRRSVVALRWLRGAPEPPRYRSSTASCWRAREPGVYARSDELIYYGGAVGEATIRSRLLEHFY